MTTAREQAREAATKHQGRRDTYDLAKRSADAASDVWEPIVQRVQAVLDKYERDWIAGRLNDVKTATEVLTEVEEALGGD